MTYPYRLVITRPGNLFPVVFDREISLEQRDLILETLDDEGNAYLEAGTNEARQDINRYFGPFGQPEEKR